MRYFRIGINRVAYAVMSLVRNNENPKDVFKLNLIKQ